MLTRPTAPPSRRLGPLLTFRAWTPVIVVQFHYILVMYLPIFVNNWRSTTKFCNSWFKFFKCLCWNSNTFDNKSAIADSSWFADSCEYDSIIFIFNSLHCFVSLASLFSPSFYLSWSDGNLFLSLSLANSIFSSIKNVC